MKPDRVLAASSTAKGAQVATLEILNRAEAHYKEGQWEAGHGVLWSALENSRGDEESADLLLGLVDGHNHEDFKRGLQRRWDKYHLLEKVESIAASNDNDHLRGRGLHHRGVALHIDFIMATGDTEREGACFTEAAAIFEKLGDAAAYALATAFLGIFYHVDLVDRDTARPILTRALAHADEVHAPIAHSEATRHLGQIEQELGNPLGGLPYLHDSLRVRKASGWSSLVPSALHAIASARLSAGDLDGAAADLTRARQLAEAFDAQLTLALIAKTEADLQLARIAPGVWNRAHP